MKKRRKEKEQRKPPSKAAVSRAMGSRASTCRSPFVLYVCLSAFARSAYAAWRSIESGSISKHHSILLPISSLDALSTLGQTLSTQDGLTVFLSRC